MIRPLVLAALLAAPAAEAATVTFTNLPAYDAALGAPSTVSETFDGGTLNGSAIQQVLGARSFNNNRLQGVAGGGANPAKQFTTLVFSTRVTAFAAAFGNLAAGEIAHVLLDGLQAATITGGTTFFGIQSTVAFSSITFLDTTFPTVNTQFFIDNMRVSPIPVAAAAPMLLGGIGMLAALRRRRRG
ncbi:MULTISPECIES: hypothetical protein [Paracoccaceae]|jgi:hypothetical protein|uniref:hypothetical protein n=1 Tax=Paracoccaceae TaxID=31989 RepID=UPI0030693D06